MEAEIVKNAVEEDGEQSVKMKLKTAKHAMVIKDVDIVMAKGSAG